MNGPFRSWISPLPPLNSRSRQPLFLFFHKRILVLFLLLLIAPRLVAQARDINVGSSAELADAIRNANDGDTIVLTADIIMTDHPATVSANITVDGMGGTISGNDRYRIFFVGPKGQLTIKNLTLTKGNAHAGSPPCPSYVSPDGDGGAICNEGGVTISDSTFTNNSAVLSGGAIFAWWRSGVTISGSSFTNNSAVYGGAISDHGTLSISDSSFTNNSAVDPDYADGGAISFTGNLLVDGSSFVNNVSAHGGAISAGSGKLIIRGSSFRGNVASDDYPQGGALKLMGIGEDSRIACVSNSSFEGNYKIWTHSGRRYGEAICVENYATLYSSGNRFVGGDYIEATEGERGCSGKVSQGGGCPIAISEWSPPEPSPAEALGDPPMRISNCVSTATDTWFKLTLLGSEIEAGDALHVSIKAEDGAAFRHLLEVPRAQTQAEKDLEILAATEGFWVTALFGEVPLADVIYNTAKTVYDVKKAVSDWNANYAASEALTRYKEFSTVLTEDATADREFLIHGRHENGGKMTVELTRRGVSEDDNATVAYRTGATPVCQYSH